MMKYSALVLVLLLVGCSKPDPYDVIRGLRRGYELSIDLTVNKEGEATYELRGRNLTGKEELSEVTTLVCILDKDDKILWSKLVELEVTGVGSFATAKQQFKDQVGVMDYDSYYVMLAPDKADDDFMSYREFMRVAP